MRTDKFHGGILEGETFLLCVHVCICALGGLLDLKIYLPGRSKVQYTNVSYASPERRSLWTSFLTRILLSCLSLDPFGECLCSLPAYLPHIFLCSSLRTTKITVYLHICLSLSSQSACWRNGVSCQNPSHHWDELGHRKSALGRNMGAMSRSDGLRDVWSERPCASRERDEFLN